jgi:thiol-disulfide isomerase/thioredoxin
MWVGEGRKFAAQQSVVVTKTGSFEADFETDGEKPVALMAFDKAQKRGGFVVLTPANFGDPIKIEIANLVNVAANFDVGNIRGNPETVEMIFESAPDRAPLMRMELPAKKRAVIRIPAGKYTLRVGCDGGERDPREILIPQKGTHDLGEKLVLNPVTSKHARKEEEKAEKGGKDAAKKPGGKVATSLPKFNVTDAVGVDKSVKLEDYRGKWLVLEFWGHWCGPCVNVGLPAWFKFADEHKADADRFAVLTFHHSRDPRKEPDIASIKQRIERLLTSRWKREKFPFPILIDSTHSTEAAWGVTGYPTAFLIDPEGNIVAQDHHGIDARLAEELKKSPAKPKKPGG